MSLDDFDQADLILIVGPEPRHEPPADADPLETAKRNGARIIAVNPLPEAGLMRFKDPQTVSGVLGGGTPIADDFLQIRLAATWRCSRRLGRLLLELEDEAPGTVLDADFIDAHSAGFAGVRRAPAVGRPGRWSRRPPA